MEIVVTFPVWLAAIDVYLDRLGCPRVIADMPAGLDCAFATWFGRGVTAYTVVAALVTLPWPGRATLDEDPLVPQRRQEVAQRLIHNT